MLPKSIETGALEWGYTAIPTGAGLPDVRHCL